MSDNKNESKVVDLSSLTVDQIGNLSDEQIDKLLNRQKLIDAITEKISKQDSHKAQLEQLRRFGEDLEATRQVNLRLQKYCTHRKGGDGEAGAVRNGQGNHTNHCIIHHGLMNGDEVMVCTRCFKIWLMPVQSTFANTPEGQSQYNAELTEYYRVQALPTNNRRSGSYLLSGPGFVEKYRETLANSIK